MTDAAMLAFILRRVRASTLFLAPYDKLQRKMLKLALTVSARSRRTLLGKPTAAGVFPAVG